jgi:hypothetical protein
MHLEGGVEKFALSIAIGSLLIFGAFLIVDASVDSFLGEFERNVALSSWTVVAAVPTVTFAYILGAFIQVLSDVVIRRFSPRALEEELLALEQLARSGSEILAVNYEELRRAKKLLEGCAFPLVVLAVGIFMEIARLPWLRSLLVVCGVFTFAAACSVPLITSRLQRSLVRVGEIAAKVPADGKRSAV